MHLDELRSVIASSIPADWHKISCYGADTATSYLYDLDKSSGADGWELHLDQHNQVFVYRPNVNLTMATGLPLDQGREWEDPELRADMRGKWLDVFWCGALVDRQLLFLVDGGRGVLPAFERELVDTGQLDMEDVGKTATTSEIRVARLVHCLGNNISRFEDDRAGRGGFDFYFSRSGIIEVPDDASV